MTDSGVFLGSSLMSEMEFFVVPKNGMSESQTSGEKSVMLIQCYIRLSMQEVNEGLALMRTAREARL